MKIVITIDGKQTSAIQTIMWAIGVFLSSFLKGIKANAWVIWLSGSLAVIGYDILTWQFWVVCIPTMFFQVVFSK